MKSPTEWLDFFDDNLDKMTVKSLIEAIQAEAVESTKAAFVDTASHWKSQAKRLRSEHDRMHAAVVNFPNPSSYQISADVYESCARELEAKCS